SSLVHPAGAERLTALAGDPHATTDDVAAHLAAAGVDLLPVRTTTGGHPARR
ncbi:MAG: hypothetical protein HZB46_14560, partial [Solirubrobacterales bacterium]|nr:hypothetical protein [Solirubrobacterales bacterium]